MRNRIAILFALALPAGGCDTGATPVRAAALPSTALSTPSIRHQVDAARHRVWFLTPDGVSLFEASRAEKVAFVLPGWIVTGEEYACLPDLSIGPQGEAIVSSNVVSTLWRIDPETLAVSVHEPVLDADTDKDVGFSGLVYAPEHRAYFAVSHGHGTLWRIDPQLVRAQKVSLSQPISGACGLGVRKRGSPPPVGKLAGLCVRTSPDSWSVDFAPDGRSAYVGAAPCAEGAM
jgi:hypothetical protein